jgi:hypothetical protein
MRFLVILDARSAIGGSYAKGNNDGFMNDGNIQHPVLDCLEVATDAPYYLFAKRDMSNQGKQYQSLYIPHGSVVAIYCYSDEGSKPCGFITPRYDVPGESA